MTRGKRLRGPGKSVVCHDIIQHELETGMRARLITLSVVLGILILSGPAFAAATIYCANHRITVRSQSAAVLKRSFADLCQLNGPMDEGSANQRASRQFGGENASCSCD